MRNESRTTPVPPDAFPPAALKWLRERLPDADRLDVPVLILLATGVNPSVDELCGLFKVTPSWLWSFNDRYGSAGLWLVERHTCPSRHWADRIRMTRDGFALIRQALSVAAQCQRAT